MKKNYKKVSFLLLFSIAIVDFASAQYVINRKINYISNLNDQQFQFFISEMGVAYKDNSGDTVRIVKPGKIGEHIRSEALDALKNYDLDVGDIFGFSCVDSDWVITHLWIRITGLKNGSVQTTHYAYQGRLSL
ncbi:MAG: hypothetical protein Ta2B_30580 [Termitinemataceae bacterium]|nr:MAG: hypothetical protein Ta2B_30580 [Termitinemataceae bacterium]